MERRERVNPPWAAAPSVVSRPGSQCSADPVAGDLRGPSSQLQVASGVDPVVQQIPLDPIEEPPHHIESIVQRLMVVLDGVRAPRVGSNALEDLRRHYELLLRNIEEEIGRPDEDLSLAAMSAVVRQTPLAFLRQFKQLTGMTPHAYVSQRRLHRARLELHQPHGTLADVAATVGYASQSHMGKAFRRTLRLTPAAYRDLIRKGDAERP